MVLLYCYLSILKFQRNLVRDPWISVHRFYLQIFLVRTRSPATVSANNAANGRATKVDEALLGQVTRSRLP